MWCLTCGVHGQLAGDFIQVGNRSAGFHGCWVHTWVEDLLGYHNTVGIFLGLGNCLSRTHGVTGFPRLIAMHIGDAVIGLPFIVTDDGGTRIHRLPCVHDGIECLIININQFKCIFGDVTIRGDDVSNFLALKPNLVCCQHCLGVIRQGWHPGEVIAKERWPRDSFQGLTCDDSDDTGQSLSR